MKTIFKNLILFIIGGIIYILIEILYRGNSHWTMGILGGGCFLLIGWINEFFSWELPLYLQGVVGAIIITILEFITGCIVNIGLGWQVWDYSALPLNLCGQICLSFSLAWIGLSMIGVVLDDTLRWLLFKEEEPKYKIF